MTQRLIHKISSFNHRQLDFVLLAGCSCLLTLLCQPMAGAASGYGSPGAYSSRIANVSTILVCHKQQTRNSQKALSRINPMR
jgi:hypothetical protein